MEEIRKSNNIVYKSFFAENDIVKEWNKDGLVHKTFWQGRPSNNSFSLKEQNTYRYEIRNILIERFGIIDEELFKTKYNEAISGDGQEWTRITTLHSSSLIALLCFYSVSKDNPIKIKEYTFTDSFFEVKTQVYQDSESNMDVVLRGVDEQGQKVVLFLECKFSEYLSTGQHKGISRDAYWEKYKELGLFDKKEVGNVIFRDDNKEIILSPKDKVLVYCSGIKQMLSHYIGVSNYSTYRNKVLAEHQRFKANEDERVLLGEILFDFGYNITGEKLGNYKISYSSLAAIINEKESSKGIKMFDDILTYQDVFIDNNSEVIKEENIKDFYKLRK